MKLVEGVAHVESVDEFVADLGDVGDAHNCAVQAFDADYVAGREHLEAAVAHANRSFERGEAIADERAVEILLYAAGRRQIRQALEMGVSDGEHDVVVVVDGDDASADEQAAATAVESLLSAAETLGEDADTSSGDAATLAAFFDVSDVEVEAAAGDLAGVVRERVALLDVEK